ncbi:hypothetical protein ACFFRR_009999 [Megaselia abdita]
MKLCFFFLGCLAFAGASTFFEKSVKYADKTFLERQKFLYDVLYKVHDEYLLENRRGIDFFVEGEQFYNDYSKINKFFELFKTGVFVPKDFFFNVFNKEHSLYAKYLFDLFYESKDFDTFYKNVIYARIYVNPDIFVYALTLTIIHKHDFEGYILPPIYEIFPQKFFHNEFINTVKSFDYDNYRYSENSFAELKEHYKNYKHFNIHEIGNKFFEIPQEEYFQRSNIHELKESFEWRHMLNDTKFFYRYAKYSDFYSPLNEENKLAYFTEDIGWNQYYYYYHLDYPFWMDGKHYGLNKDRRGELYLYMHQQILARYFLERLSNGLGEIDEFSFYHRIDDGYKSGLTYRSGLGYSSRPNYYEIYDSSKVYYYNLIESYERRIRDIIDSGFYTTVDGKKYNLRDSKSIEVLGNLIQSNPDSFDRKFFGYFCNIYHLIIGGAKVHESVRNYIVPNVFLSFETILRDPVFYSLYKRIIKFYYQYKNHLPVYKSEDLLFKGVRVVGLEVDKFVTYFDYHDSDVTTLLPRDVMMKGGRWSWDYILLARQKRLNHEKFSITIDVKSEKAHKAVVRFYLAPKYDQFGHEYDFDQNRENTVELDQFVYELKEGENKIVRRSDEFYWSVRDRTTYTELYKYILFSFEGEHKFPLDMSESHNGFPDRLVLPKGHASGYPVYLYVIVTPYNDSVKQFSNFDFNVSSGIGSGHRYIDDLPFGYPFDRKIDFFTFHETANFYAKEFKIYHNGFKGQQGKYDFHKY